MNRDAKYWIWLSHCFPYGSAEPGKIIEKYNTAKEAYKEKGDWSNEYTEKRRNRIISLKPDDFEKTIESYQKKNISILCYDDEEYSDRLKTTDSPPMVLYAVGDLTLLSKRTVAIVGTRRPTEYSKEASFRIAKDIARRGVVVVSGCAEGVDTAAHRGALEAGKTISVLGTPLNATYPASNVGLKRKMLDQGSLILTEYPLGIKTHPSMFPIRNRLISGISDAVILIQAPERSGGLITARNAMEQGKEVFCLPPGNIFSSVYDGGKQLLRDGAYPYLGIRDIEEMYRYHSDPALKGALEEHLQNGKQENPSFSPVAQMVFDELDASEGVSIETLSQRLSKDVSQIMAALTELEIDGAVLRIGNRYKKG